MLVSSRTTAAFVVFAGRRRKRFKSSRIHGSDERAAMLFHTWTFLIFMAAVLPVLFALRRTRLWIPWLLVASYVFYGWWNPYYLILVFYSTLLDFILVALMDHCPMRRKAFDWRARLARLHFDDGVMKLAFVGTAAGTLFS